LAEQQAQQVQLAQQEQQVRRVRQGQQDQQAQPQQSLDLQDQQSLGQQVRKDSQSLFKVRIKITLRSLQVQVRPQAQSDMPG
jgi:hypothetical protein